MRFSQIHTIALSGFKAELITVETDVTRGLFYFSIVGLPDKSVEESRDRICAAIKNSGFDSPKTKHHKITSSLVPANIKKAGSSFDVPIAVSYLKSIGTIKTNIEKSIFIGELSLDGRIRPARGVLQIILFAISHGFKNIFIPPDNSIEAQLALKANSSIKIFTPVFLVDIVKHLKKESLLPELKIETESGDELATDDVGVKVDLSSVQGQIAAKRAAIIAVAGGHNIFLIGPPGTGKTLIAKACAGLQPAPNSNQAIEIAAIHSLNSPLYHASINRRPFRSPHHTSSYTAIIGGGTNMLPGEISLAHHGILFLDEFPEFDRRVIESLREPLEDGIIKIARSKQREIFPARIMLVAAANPCPCGFRGSIKNRCLCKPSDIARYSKKISGPILDRIDLIVQMTESETAGNILDPKKQKTKDGILNSKQARELISKARNVQKDRSVRHGIKTETNAGIPFERILEIVNADAMAIKTLEQGSERLSLSMRARHRALRVARTIADLGGSQKVKAPHILEALCFRLREM